MKISVVSTLYRSKRFLGHFLELTLEALDKIGCTDFELVFVNDGSPDDSMQYLLQRQKQLPQIKVIDLSRNFGHHYAMQAGLEYATGEYIFLIDNDLETSPLVLIEFYDAICKDEDLDVVYGFQEVRKGNSFEIFTGKLFWILINKMSDTQIPHNILTERLMRRSYLDELLRLQDANLFLGGMFHWVGFNQQGLAVKKGQRDGPSTYSVKKRMQLMLQAITSFSGKPLEWLFYFGLFISFGSVVLIIGLIITKLLYQDTVQLGWTSIIAINVFILGIIATFLGIIGIYIFKIFKQVQGRPNAIIKRIYE